VSTSWQDRVVLLTGASSGIGRDCAIELARRGAVVIAVARREKLLASLREECRATSPRSDFLCGDLGDRAFAEHAVDETLHRCGRLDVLINNAGQSLHKQIYHTSAEDAAQVMQVNFMSCVWTTFAAIPAMLRQQSGAIVNVSSFAALVVPPREALYAASKAAMEAFSAGLWSDLDGSGIHVAIVRPGAIDTEIWDKEAEPPAFDGKKWPPSMVTAAIVEAVDQRRRLITVPRLDPALVSARVLKSVAPGVLLAGMRRFDPVPPSVLAAARERAGRGRRLGQLD
jgi:short-subunit dehydrogenase